MNISDWAQEEEDAADVNVWEDNWDDDNVEDDFSKQLRFVLLHSMRYGSKKIKLQKRNLDKNSLFTFIDVFSDGLKTK